MSCPLKQLMELGAPASCSAPGVCAEAKAGGCQQKISTALGSGGWTKTADGDWCKSNDIARRHSYTSEYYEEHKYDTALGLLPVVDDEQHIGAMKLHGEKYQKAKKDVLGIGVRQEIQLLDDKSVLGYIKSQIASANAQINSSRPEAAMRIMKTVFCAAHEYVFPGFVDDPAVVPTEIIQRLIQEWEVPPPKYKNPKRPRSEEESDAIHATNNVLLKRILRILDGEDDDAVCPPYKTTNPMLKRVLMLLEGPEDDMEVGGIDCNLEQIKRMITKLDNKLDDHILPLS
eukprot:g9960.t1